MGFVGATVRTTFIEAMRSRLFAIVILAVLAAAGLALFLGELAITETRQVQVAIIAALLRLCAVFLTIAFAVSSVTREFHDQQIALIMAQAVPRWQYIAGKLAGLVCVGLALAVFTSVPVAMFAPLERTALWAGSLACELAIVAAASLFCALTLTHLVAAFAAVSAFYLLARSLDAMQILAGGLSNHTSWSDQFLNALVTVLSHLLPNIDRMTQSSWLTDATVSIGVLGTSAAQAVVYLGVLAAASLFDFYRQNL